MPAYSFKERFVPMILDGSKTQTIRARRNKGYAKTDDTLYLYFGMRTKWCRKLKETICKKAGTVLIREDGIVVLWDRRLTEVEAMYIIENKGATDGKRLIDRVMINEDQLDEFAWLDGFRPENSTKENCKGAFDFMIRFWRQTHSLPFVGDIIYW